MRRIQRLYDVNTSSSENYRAVSARVVLLRKTKDRKSANLTPVLTHATIVNLYDVNTSSSDNYRAVSARFVLLRKTRLKVIDIILLRF